MNQRSKNFKDLRKTLLFFFFFLCSFFIFLNHHTAAHKKDAKSFGQHESVVNSFGFVITENPVAKELKYTHLPFFLECSNSISQDRSYGAQLILSEKSFSKIKILLSHAIYNQYFASGLHDPSLEA